MYVEKHFSSMAKRFIIFCNLKITHFKDKLTSFIRLVFSVIYSDDVICSPLDGPGQAIHTFRTISLKRETILGKGA